MAFKETWLACLVLLILTESSHQTMSCTYGARGSLTSTCINATPMYFRTTSYRFDNLDETVRCVNCSLQNIEGNTFDISGNQIKNLELQSSQITILKPKAFIGLVFLKRLYLQNNLITAVPPETFQGINKIEVLNLENNRITHLLQNGFKELKNLRTLNCKYNRITSIDVGAFEGLYSLEELDLSYNDVATVKDIFSSLLTVGSINLENNKIAEISPLDMKDLSGLLQLNLASNKLKAIQPDSFLSLPKLEGLNLSSNPIETLNVGSFRGLYTLEELDMSNCLISDIQKWALATLHQLRNLHLAYNRLSVFQTGVYSGLPELRRLNLSHNKIERYEKTGVFPLHSLHTLDLSFNSLKDLDYKLLVDHLPTLSHLLLNNNPWPCYLGKEMEKLFKDDNVLFVLNQEYENVHCNDTRPTGEVPPEVVEPPEMSRVAAYAGESAGHQYVLYIFICITLGLMLLLFYLQYKNQRDIREIVGRANVSEVQLISSDLESRDGNY